MSVFAGLYSASRAVDSLYLVSLYHETSRHKGACISLLGNFQSNHFPYSKTMICSRIALAPLEGQPLACPVSWSLVFRKLKSGWVLLSDLESRN